eukprot:scaffold159074_cov45-Prasinocladus_malaysianus.AAC.1
MKWARCSLRVAPTLLAARAMEQSRNFHHIKSMVTESVSAVAEGPAMSRFVCRASFKIRLQ